jgi:hypothetical protein
MAKTRGTGPWSGGICRLSQRRARHLLTAELGQGGWVSQRLRSTVKVSEECRHVRRWWSRCRRLGTRSASPPARSSGTYRDALGRRCRRRGDLEFHHWRPFGRGGPHHPAVVALMCRAHNLLLAERDYGKEKMARYRRAASRVPERLAVPGVEIVRGNSRPEPRAG